MRLSAEMFEQIISVLKSDRNKDKDKRLEPRVGLAGEANLATTENGKRLSFTVKIRDISRGGVGLTSNNLLAADQRVVIQLASNSHEPLWLICVVAYCRKIELGHFSVGVRIRQVLRSEQIKKYESQAHSVEVAVKTTQAEDVKRAAQAIIS